MSPSPDPAEAIVPLSGHVQRIYWTDFNCNFTDVSCWLRVCSMLFRIIAKNGTTRDIRVKNKCSHTLLIFTTSLVF